jgi:hypothetical protein
MASKLAFVAACLALVSAAKCGGDLAIQFKYREHIEGRVQTAKPDGCESRVMTYFNSLIALDAHINARDGGDFYGKFELGSRLAWVCFTIDVKRPCRGSFGLLSCDNKKCFESLLKGDKNPRRCEFTTVDHLGFKSVEASVIQRFELYLTEMHLAKAELLSSDISVLGNAVARVDADVGQVITRIGEVGNVIADAVALVDDHVGQVNDNVLQVGQSLADAVALVDVRVGQVNDNVLQVGQSLADAVALVDVRVGQVDVRVGQVNENVLQVGQSLAEAVAQVNDNVLQVGQSLAEAVAQVDVRVIQVDDHVGQVDDRVVQVGKHIADAVAAVDAQVSKVSERVESLDSSISVIHDKLAVLIAVAEWIGSFRVTPVDMAVTSCEFLVAINPRLFGRRTLFERGALLLFYLNVIRSLGFGDALTFAVYLMCTLLSLSVAWPVAWPGVSWPTSRPTSRPTPAPKPSPATPQQTPPSVASPATPGGKAQCGCPTKKGHPCRKQGSCRRCGFCPLHCQCDRRIT